MKILLLVIFQLLSSSCIATISLLTKENSIKEPENNYPRSSVINLSTQSIEKRFKHKLKTSDRLKLKLINFLLKKQKDQKAKTNRLALISLIFSVTGLIVMIVFFTVSFYSFIGIGLCLIGFILSNITFRRGKKNPDLLSKRDDTINSIAYFIGLLGIALVIIVGLLIWFIGTIFGGIASVGVP